MKCLCVALALISTAPAACPPAYPFEYVDRVHEFRICLPAGVTKEAAPAYPAGSVLFNGFVLEPKTNLRSKQLVIVPGDYDLLKNATPFGHFSAKGETFERAKFEEGSAGHLDLHVIYTWKRGNNFVHSTSKIARSTSTTSIPDNARPNTIATKRSRSPSRS